MRPRDVPATVTDQLRRLHASIDGSARRLEVLHADRLQCRRGCSDCCVDDLTVSIAEAARIVAENAELLSTGAPGPVGRCAMLDADGACRIYASRPYVCRTQGLPLRWTALDGPAEDGARVEHRDICPKNEPAAGSEIPPLEDLAPDACWTLGAAEQVLAAIDGLTGGTGERCALRDLFGVAMLHPSPGNAGR